MAQNNISVNTNVRITKEQREYLKQSPYNLSGLVRKTLNDLMNKENS